MNRRTFSARWFASTSPAGAEIIHENPCWFRDHLRLRRTHADDADAERASVTRRRRHQARSAPRLTCRAVHALSRRVRQCLHPSGRASGPTGDFHRRPGCGFRTAGSGGAGSAPARSRRTAARRPGVPAGQPILRDRAPDGGCVVALRPDAAGLGAGPGDLRLRPFPRALRLSARARHQDRDRRHHRAPRRVPRLRPSRDHAVPLHEHPGALLHRLSRRHRRSAGARSDGFQRLVRGLSRRPLVRVRCPPQHSPHRPHRHGARP